MSSTKLDTSGVFSTASAAPARLSLIGDEVRVRKNGIEFRSPDPLPIWREMSVELISPVDGKKIQCTGVVVACDGARRTGFVISMVFLNLSRQSQEKLATLSAPRVA